MDHFTLTLTYTHIHFLFRFHQFFLSLYGHKLPVLSMDISSVRCLHLHWLTAEPQGIFQEFSDGGGGGQNRVKGAVGGLILGCGQWVWLIMPPRPPLLKETLLGYITSPLLSTLTINRLHYCLTLLASLFLPSHLSLKHLCHWVVWMHVHVCVYVCVCLGQHIASHVLSRQEHPALGSGFWRLPQVPVCPRQQHHGYQGALVALAVVMIIVLSV